MNDQNLLVLNEQPCYRINRPEWYRDPAWIAWLNSGKAATWHKQGQQPSEYSDVFFWYDQGEGSDWPGDFGLSIPDHIWQELRDALGDTSCIVWITNLELETP